MKSTQVVVHFFLAFLFCGIHAKEMGIVFAQTSTALSAPVGNKPILEKMTFEPYTYTVRNRRDPFVPLPAFGFPGESKLVPSLDPEISEGSVILLGIIRGKAGYQALLTLPNGERVIVGQGSFIENTSERVKSITKDMVILARVLDSDEDNHILEQTLALSH